MKILITGGTGFIGQQLCQHFRANKHDLLILSRQTPAKVRTLCGADAEALSSLHDIESTTHIDVVINLAGEPIADARWGAQRKAILRESRYSITKQLIELIERLEHKPSVLISGSAVGFYGNQNDINVDESTLPHKEFTHDLCALWEDIANQANLHTRVCILRTGLVIGASGGFLAKMWLPFKLCLGGILGSGKQFMPWIHINDLVASIQFLIDDASLRGAFNATAPRPVTNREFVKALGKAVSRPTFFHTPEFILRILLGEMSRLLLTGQNAIPQKLLDAGFEFSFTSIDSALTDVSRNKGYFY